jgi:putative flippase GtrA
MKKKFFEFVRYVLVGIVATVVDYGGYYILTRFLFFPATSANPVAYLVGNVVSFLGQRSVTFRSHGHPGRQYLRFLVVNVTGLIISQFTLVVLLRLGVDDLIAKAAGVITSGTFNYLANRFWTFKAV